MIFVDQALCTGCQVCVDECPTGAIFMSNGTALVDSALCDNCQSCIEVCPDGALTWIAETVPETETEPSSLAVVQPPLVVIPAATNKPLPWRRAVFPAVAGAVSWVGREIVPRLAPLALNILDNTLELRYGRSERDKERTLASTERGQGQRGRQRRRRRRRG